MDSHMFYVKETQLQNKLLKLLNCCHEASVYAQILPSTCNFKCGDYRRLGDVADRMPRKM